MLAFLFLVHTSLPKLPRTFLQGHNRKIDLCTSFLKQIETQMVVFETVILLSKRTSPVPAAQRKNRGRTDF